MIPYIATGVGAFVFGYLVYWIASKIKKEQARSTATRIKGEAEKEAEHIMREAKVTAKSEILKMKEDFENELKERRKEEIAIEKRLTQREENIEKKAEVLESRMKGVERREKELDSDKERITSKEEELKKAITQQIDALERVTQLDRETAKQMLLEKLKGEIQNETGILIRNLLDEAKERSEKEARNILTCAIQRYASECTYERTTATIPLPSDEMKGRIIGRE
ncbi:MAG: Rnase Y domain-containing protein, partial [Victivallales bacterium]